MFTWQTVGQTGVPTRTPWELWFSHNETKELSTGECCMFTETAPRYGGGAENSPTKGDGTTSQPLEQCATTYEAHTETKTPPTGEGSR